MAKTALSAILHLEHVDATDGSGAAWFDASTGGVSALSPRGVQYVPCIDGQAVSPLRESVVDGRTSRAPAPPADASVTLLRYVGGKDRLAALDGRSFLGRQAVHGYVGTGADGTVYTPAAPLVIASGTVVPPVETDSDRIRLTIRAGYRFLSTELPDRPLLGYRTGVLGNGDAAATTVITVTGYSTISAATTLAALVLVPRKWDLGASDTHAIWANKGLYFGAKRHTDGYSWRLFCRYSTTTGGTLEEILGPVIEPDEVLHLLSCRFTTATKTAIFGVDTTFSTAVGSAAFVALSAAEDWQMMRFRTDATSVSSTLMGAFMLFTSALTDGEVAALAATPARGDEAALKLYYRETDGAGTYLDEAAANAASPIDATITAGTETSLFEGPPELAGVKPPLILQGQHMPLVPVDHARLIYRASKYPIENVSRVTDRGVDLTLAHRYSVKDLITNAPAAGEVAVTPDMGGLLRFNSLADGAELAADVQGSGGWPWSLALGTGHAAAEVDFGSALGADLVAAGNYGLEICFRIFDAVRPVPVPTTAAPVFHSTFLRVSRGPSPTFTVRVEGTAGDLFLFLEEFPNLTTVCLRVEAWNNGSDMAARALINGNVVASDVKTGSNLSNTTAGAAILGDNGGGLGLVDLGALPMSAWSLPSPTTRTDADAEADHRAHLFEHPSFSDPNLIGYWYRPTTSLAQVDDETGNGYHGTVVNGGTYGKWRPGLCWSDPLHAVAYLARDRGGFDLDDLTITEAAWQGIEAAAQDLWITENTPMAAAIHAAAGPGYLLRRADGSLVLGLIAEASAANSVGTLAGVLEVSSKTIPPTQGDSGMPPSVIWGRYGRIGAVGQTALAGADSERRALMGAEYREDKVPVGDNATIYDDAEFPAGIRLESTARYRDAAPTRRALEALALVWADPRPVYTVRLEGAGRELVEGDIWTVRDPRTGTAEHVLIMGRVTGPDAETVEVR